MRFQLKSVTHLLPQNGSSSGRKKFQACSAKHDSNILWVTSNIHITEILKQLPHVRAVVSRAQSGMVCAIANHDAQQCMLFGDTTRTYTIKIL
jgi:hypothetical protein